MGDLLARVVTAHGELECLVLHTCRSDEIARACAAHVPHVVGSTDAIDDKTAPRFTDVFHQALTHRPPRVSRLCSLANRDLGELARRLRDVRS